MASKKTQQELEQAVKGYQLDAVQSKVDAIEKQMTEGFQTVNDSLKALLLKSNSQVTPQQLADNITALKNTVEDQMREEINKIHLEYGPIKENNKWFLRAVIGQGIVILGLALFTLAVTGNS